MLPQALSYHLKDVPLLSHNLHYLTAPCTIFPHLALPSHTLHYLPTPCTTFPHLALIFQTSHYLPTPCTTFLHLALPSHTWHYLPTPRTNFPNLALPSRTLHYLPAPCTTFVFQHGQRFAPVIYWLSLSMTIWWEIVSSARRMASLDLMEPALSVELIHVARDWYQWVSLRLKHVHGDGAVSTLYHCIIPYWYLDS
jgi:hypothetical protein